jgi:hypothetical protein
MARTIIDANGSWDVYNYLVQEGRILILDSKLITSREYEQVLNEANNFNYGLSRQLLQGNLLRGNFVGEEYVLESFAEMRIGELWLSGVHTNLIQVSLGRDLSISKVESRLFQRVFS